MRFNKVLLIDDDDLDIYLSKRIISNAAFAEEVVTANSVKSAMDYLEKNSNGGSLPDFIFLDLNMPGQNGLDFLNEYAAFEKKNKSSSTIALLMNVVQSEEAETRNAKSHPLVKYVFEKPLTETMLKSISKP